jgi:hypothetical protein
MVDGEEVSFNLRISRIFYLREISIDNAQKLESQAKDSQPEEKAEDNFMDALNGCHMHVLLSGKWRLVQAGPEGRSHNL